MLQAQTELQTLSRVSLSGVALVRSESAAAVMPQVFVTEWARSYVVPHGIVVDPPQLWPSSSCR
eukprot:1190077-Amphidinium_carterae.2